LFGGRTQGSPLHRFDIGFCSAGEHKVRSIYELTMAETINIKKLLQNENTNVAYLLKKQP